MAANLSQASETLDHLAGDWKIFQLKHGHRFSADDLLTAWTAARVQPQADRVLDLGCGIGSVGLLTLWKLGRQVQLVGVEVQSLSLGLARRTLAYNQLDDRVTLLLHDLRQPLHLGRFPLITASPPYFPCQQATLSPHPQRAAARCELHGDVFDYCLRAAAHLESQGRFVFVHSAHDSRPLQAISAAGLTLLARQPVYFRRQLEPTIALFTCAWQGDRSDPEAFVIRDREGRWTPEYLTMRAEMGTPGLKDRPR